MTAASDPLAAVPSDSLASDLLLGGEAIAIFVYGKAGTKELRDIYRNVLQLPLFKHGNMLAALKSTLREHIAEKQSAAQRRQQDER